MPSCLRATVFVRGEKNIVLGSCDVLMFVSHSDIAIWEHIAIEIVRMIKGTRVVKCLRVPPAGEASKELEGQYQRQRFGFGTECHVNDFIHTYRLVLGTVTIARDEQDTERRLQTTVEEV